jgi:transposase
MLIRKAFKFRVYPNVEQQEKLAVQFGCARFVYNHYRRGGVVHDRDTNAAINLKPKLLRESQKVTPVEKRAVVRHSAPEAQRL